MPTTSDLAVQSFLILRDVFFDSHGRPVRFTLPPKGNTQDDPLDTMIAEKLAKSLPEVTVQRAPGALTSPDMALYRDRAVAAKARDALRDDTSAIVGIEVKKLEVNERGQVARVSGLDYNSTPPCGTIVIYDSAEEALAVRGFYLFLAIQNHGGGAYSAKTLVMCDGNILNSDFDLYERKTSKRKKEINLGTYGDGADRVRPMMIFSNPLSAADLDSKATIITKDTIADERLTLAYRFHRQAKDNGPWHSFNVYAKAGDVPADHKVIDRKNPFAQPKERTEDTQGRGKFVIPIRPKA